MFPDVDQVKNCNNNKGHQFKQNEQLQDQQTVNVGVLGPAYSPLEIGGNRNWSNELREDFRTLLRYFFGNKETTQNSDQPAKSRFILNTKRNSRPAAEKLNSKTNCTASNDKTISEYRHNSGRKHTRCHSIRGNSSIGQNSWISTCFDDSLKRKFSLQDSSRQKRNFFVRERKEIDKSPRGKSKKTPRNLTPQLMEANKRIKCLLDSNTKRFHSWSNGFHTLCLFVTIYILMITLHDSMKPVALGASIPAPKVEPKWLLDELMSLDSNMINDAGPLATNNPTLSEVIISSEDLSRMKAPDIEQADTNILSEANQAYEPVSYENEKPLTFNQASYSLYPLEMFDRYLSSEVPESLDQQKDEFVWLQRRRLNRDRALEPPPWLRVQPTRRGGLSLTEQTRPEIEPNIAGIKGNKPQESVYEEVSTNEEELNERQVRDGAFQEPSEDIYEGIIKHIIDQAMADSSLLDQLYEEFEMKVKNPPNKSLNRLQQQRLLDLSSVQDEDMQKSAHLQKQQALESLSSDLGPQDALVQKSDPDTTLVVVGDEVSSDDDVTDLASNTNIRSFLHKAGFTDPDSAYDTYKNNEFGFDKVPVVSDFNLQQQSRDSDGNLYGTFQEGRSAGLLTEPSFSNSELSFANLIPNSFHVLEDVDRLDAAQDIPIPADSLDEDFQYSQRVSPLKWIMKPDSLVDASSLLKIAKKRNNAYSDQQKSTLFRPRSPSSLTSLLDNLEEPSKVQLRDQLAITMIDHGFLTQDQLIKTATKMRNYIEDSIGLSRAAIVGLYPLNNKELLIKIDSSKLSEHQMMNMITNYGFVRGYIVAKWRKGSKQSPLPLLSAILRALASGYSKAHGFTTTPDLATFGSSVAQVAATSSQLAPQLLDEYISNQVDGVKQSANVLLDRPTLASYLEAILLSRSKLDAIKAAKLNEKLTKVEEAHRWLNLDARSSYLLALIAALLCAFIAVKLVTRSSGARNLRERLARSGSFRSLWSSHSDLVYGNSATGKELEAGNLPPPSYSSVESHCTDGSELPLKQDSRGKQEGRGFAQLAQRLNALLRRQEKANEAELLSSSCLKNATTSSKSDEIDEDALADEDELLETQRSSRFRSSRSYIRSLVEVLSRSRVALSMSTLDPLIGDRLVKDGSQVNESRSESRAQAPIGNHDADATVHGTPTAVSSSQECSAVAQMDISGAHLILDYMEKHLEDKERLKREWLALNGRPGKPKLAQVLLQRLARVALSEECCTARNRDPQVVPFDRNRVKLAGGCTGPPGDYINASYIHDDDMRRPTHIIAQGPTEQTSGHFWQMVWEQGVSVIVMLTRLNENGTRMSHCYWPANSSSYHVQPPNLESTQGETQSPDGLASPGASATRQVAATGLSFSTSKDLGGKSESPQAGDSNSALLSPSLSTAGSPSEVPRRVSITSVFSNIGVKPIVANGDLANNVLYFDIELPGTQRENTSSPQERKTDGTSTGETEKSVLKLEVHLVSEHVSSSDYLVRNMYLINRNTCETRTITQFHYLDWPENGVPSNVRNFLEFRRKVHKSYRNLKNPILVHCSDGAGRSGTYTLVDIILERIRSGAKEIDPRATLEHLRDQRMGLCASQNQFEFVLVALAEEIQIILDALPH